MPNSTFSIIRFSVFTAMLSAASSLRRLNIHGAPQTSGQRHLVVDSNLLLASFSHRSREIHDLGRSSTRAHRCALTCELLGHRGARNCIGTENVGAQAFQISMRHALNRKTPLRASRTSSSESPTLQTPDASTFRFDSNLPPRARLVMGLASALPTCRGGRRRNHVMKTSRKRVVNRGGV